MIQPYKVRPCPRNFLGYGRSPPDVVWPEQTRLAVSFVLNIEEGAELSIGDGDERNEYEYEEIMEVKNAPDLCMESHFEYGTRVAYWRIVDLFSEFGFPLTLNVCARALERSPWIGKDAVRRGHEISCHGYRWEGSANLYEGQERALIARVSESIERTAGVRPLGWHTRSGATLNTRRILAESGFLYDSDAYNDDLPYMLSCDGTAFVIVPYSLDTNDMRFFQPHGFLHGHDFADYCVGAIDWLRKESERHPKMLTIGLHMRIIGRPGRIGGLEKVLQHLQCLAGKIWIAKRVQIARHWLELHKNGSVPFLEVG